MAGPIVSRRVGAVLLGFAAFALAGCSAPPQTVSPGPPSVAPTPATTAVSASPSAAASLAATQAPLDTVAPWPTGPDQTPAPSLPPVLAGLKTLDVSGFRTSATPADAYRLSSDKRGIVLTYDTGHAKGSIAIGSTKAEGTYFSEGPSEPQPVWDASHVVVVLVTEPRYEGPVGIGSGQDRWFLPMSWRILVAPLDKNGKPSAFSEFATGKSVLKVQTPNFVCGECSGGVAVWPPNVGLSDGLIAYNVEKATRAQPFGSEILVRSLADGSTVRDLSTLECVYRLELSSANLVWIEYPGVTTYTLPLRISTTTHPDAQDLLVYKTPGWDLQWNVPPYLLDGNLLVWQASSAGKVWQRDIASGKIRQISPEGVVCQLGDFDGANVVMGCASPEAAAGDPPVTAWDSYFIPEWILFWSPVTGYVLLTGTPSFSEGYSAEIANGSLWLDFADENMNHTAWTIPIGSLTGR